MIVRTADMDDATEIAYIYNHYIATSHATFELEPIDHIEISRRINEAGRLNYPFVVCADGDTLLGYAYAKAFRSRQAYRHTAEISVYIKPGHYGQGIATLLYTQLLSDLRSPTTFHTIVAGISLPNDASVRLHEKFGFEKVAHFYQVGQKFDRWIDVGYWELLLHK